MSLIFRAWNSRKERPSFGLRSIAAGAALLLGLATASTATAGLIQYRADFATPGATLGDTSALGAALESMAGEPLFGLTDLSVLWTIDDAVSPTLLSGSARYELVALELIFHSTESNFTTPVLVPVPSAITSPSASDHFTVGDPGGSVDGIRVFGSTPIPIGTSGAFITNINLEVLTPDLSILTSSDLPTAAELNALNASVQSMNDAAGSVEYPSQVIVEGGVGTTSGSFVFLDPTFSSQVLADPVSTPQPGALSLLLGGLAFLFLGQARRRRKIK